MSATQIDERPSWGGLTEAEAEQGRRLIEEEMDLWKSGNPAGRWHRTPGPAGEAACLRQIIAGHKVLSLHHGWPSRCPVEVLVRLVELEEMGY